MRYAIFSDVHANETALRAMLADAADARAEKFICLGDVTGYGPEPAQTLELVYRKAHVCLAGNHDDAAAGRFPVEDFTSVAAAAIARHKSALKPNALDWLAHLPYVHSESCFACAHGSFVKPEKFDYILEAQDAALSLEVRTEQLLFVGHSHKPGIFVSGASGKTHELPAGDFVLENGKRYVVNVGSVGYPRSGICRSSYCIFDNETSTVYFRSFPFDLEGYRAKMNGVGIDEAPWVRARAEERARPEVRRAESFARNDATAAGRKVKRGAGVSCTRAQSVRISTPSVALPAAQPAGPGRGRFGTAFFAGAAIAAFAGIWCTVTLVRAVPEKPDVSGVQIAAAEEEPETLPTDVAPAATGALIAGKRCTVPATGRKIAFNVKLRRGGAPAWVHVRFENGNGEVAGDGLWYQNVKSSKRSPKRGIEAPEGATAAFIEVLKAHDKDECEVVELSLEPFKEKKK